MRKKNLLSLATAKESAHQPDVELLASETGPLIDSRHLSILLGNSHRHVIAMAAKYRDEMKDMGKLRFKKAVDSNSSRGGNPARYMLLSEEQTMFLLTLSRNTPRIVALKRRLIHAFCLCRWERQLHEEGYLPTYHALHSRVAELSIGSKHARHAHMNFNRLLNDATGIPRRGRGHASVAQKALLTVAQTIVTNAMRGAREGKEGYKRAKAALKEFSRLPIADGTPPQLDE